jgi:iron complex outermembrane receptor protein
MSVKHLMGVSVSALMLAACLGTAVAQEEAGEEENRRVKRMDTVMVEAERREASILDTPVAVTAVSSEQRDILGILDQSDLANYTPGMTYQESPNRITIRGIGRLTNAQGSDPGVATYVDGIYTSEAAEIGRGSLFVERTEVLRGPQGTLFGRNSIGGAVNIITKKPEFEYGGEARLRYGSFDRLEAGATFTGPVPGLEKTTAFRINADAINQFEGSQNNAAPDGKEVGANDYTRLDLMVTHDFTDNLNAFFRYATTHYQHRPGSSRRVDPYPQNGPYYNTITPNVYYGLTDINPGVADPQGVSLDYPQVIRMTDNHAFNLVVEWETELATLKYLGSHQNYDWESFTDADGLSRRSHNIS